MEKARNRLLDLAGNLRMSLGPYLHNRETRLHTVTWVRGRFCQRIVFHESRNAGLTTRVTS